MQQVERIAPKKFQAESRIKSLLVCVVWGLAVSGLFNDAIHGNLLAIAGFALIQFWFTSRIWSVSVDEQGLKLQRIHGLKRIAWADIDDIAYSGITEEVAEVFVKGRRISIPRGPNHSALSQIIESNCVRQISRDCHMEFAAPRLAPLLQPSIAPEELKFAVVAYVISFAFMGVALGWQSAVVLFGTLTVIALPFGLALHLYSSLSRVHRVRLTQRGIGIHTTFGRYEITWQDMSLAMYEQSRSQLEIRANGRTFKFGHELTNFRDLLRLIEDKSNAAK